MRLNIDGTNYTIAAANDPEPPTVGVFDIDIPANTSARFDVDFDNAIPYLAGNFNVTFSFEYPDLGVSCVVTREAYKPPATATPTPASTPTP